MTRQIVIAILIIMFIAVPASAQRLTNTPAPVSIPDVQPVQPTSVLVLTPTPTLSPTPDLPEVFLEAIEAPANINVRDYPDGTGNRLGSMEPGVQYRVTGRYIAWYQFEYPDAPEGVAWVFGSLVRVIGDESEIPNIDPNIVPTEDSQEAFETATAEARLLTPDVANTATAEARELAIPTSELGSASNQEFPPTFTPPSDVFQRVPTASADLEPTPEVQGDLLQRTITTITSGALPPVLPILVLFGFGVFGLLVSSLRR